MVDSEPRSLLEQARMAAMRAYSPYSGWRVGAAVEFAETSDSGHHLGANIENASFSLTICAERVAIFGGVLAGGKKLLRLALTCRDREGALVSKIVPCGACLQVITEFGTPDTTIEIDGRGTFRLADFLPLPFGADELKD